MQSTRRARCSAEASRKFHKNAFKSPHASGFFDVFQQSTNKPTTHNMKNFASFRVVTLALVAGYMLKTTSADADVTFLGVAGGDATTNDIIVWTRAKDEANPQPTAINVQISTDPTFTTGVTTLPAGTAGSPTDYTVKSNVGGLEPGTFTTTGSKPPMPRSQAMSADLKPLPTRQPTLRSILRSAGTVMD
jgi:hypothetical protein